MKIYHILILFIILAFIPCTTVHAETFAEKCQRMQAENDKAFLEGLERDGNLTQDAIDTSKMKTNLKPNKKASTKTNSNTNSSSYTGKGWVYSSDELHIIGLPEDEQGYTRSGDYGVIPAK